MISDSTLDEVLAAVWWNVCFLNKKLPIPYEIGWLTFPKRFVVVPYVRFTFDPINRLAM